MNGNEVQDTSEEGGEVHMGGSRGGVYLSIPSRPYPPTTPYTPSVGGMVVLGGKIWRWVGV